MNQLQVKVLLAAVDKITAPLKRIRGATGNLNTDIKAQQDRIKQLNKQMAQVNSYKTVNRNLGITSAALVKSQRETAMLAQEIKATSAPSKELTRNFEKARAATVRLQTQQRQLTINQQRQRDALRNSGIDTRNLATHQRQLSSELTTANQRLLQQRQRLEQVSNQQKRLTAARQSYGNMRQVQGQLAGSGAAMLATGAAAGYAGSRFLAPGMDFAASQSRVQALTRLDKNDAQLKALREQARQLGATTSFTSTDVSAGQAFLAMAGFTPSSIKAAMPSMLDLAKAGDLDLGQSADIASNILSAFKLPADEMTRVADVMALAMTTSNVNLQMLGETMKYVAPIANTVGMSLEETAAAAGLLGNIGIQSSQAGTVLRSMLNRLAGPSSAASKVMAELGLNVKNADGSMRNITDILAETAKLTEEFGNADRLAIFKELFGEEAAAGINELISQSGAGEFAKYANQIKTEHNGVAARIAKTMADNAKGDLEELKSAWQDVGIELFEGNDSAIRAFIKDITGVVSSIGQWMRDNKALTATLFKVAAVITGLAIAGGSLTLMLAGILGPLAILKLSASYLGIKALPSLLGVVKLLTGGILKLGMALLTTPIGWIILGITALIAVGYLLIKHWDTVWNWVGSFFTGIADYAAAGTAAVIGWFGDMWQSAGELWQNGITTLTDIFSGLPEPVQAILSGLWDFMKTVFSWTPLGLIVNNWEQIIGFFGGLPERFSELGGNMMSGLVNGITGKLADVRDTITNAASSAIGWFKDVLGIKSPSRVFAQAGDDTMAGLALGIQRSSELPIKQAADMGKQLQGTALAMGLAVSPVAATTEPPSLISSPFSQAAPVTGSTGQRTIQIDASITAPITIYAQPGMSEQDIARLVATQLDQRQRAQQAALRATLQDLE